MPKPDSLRSINPIILLVATVRWPIAARLAIVFAGMGCRVEAICPRQHPVISTSSVRRVHAYSQLRPQRSLYAAIRAAMPDLIIPCDDNAAVHLHRLYSQENTGSLTGIALRAIIADSLGAPEACMLATARGRFMELAEAEHVRVPVNKTIASHEDIDTWLAKHRLPAVMKIDSTWGGQGVVIVKSREQAHRTFAQLSTRPTIASALSRTLLDRDPLFVLKSMYSGQRTVTMQTFITGASANRAVACWQGKVLAGISVEAIRTLHPTGPATVVRVIENVEMSEAVARLVKRLGVSGLWGVDFVLEAATGAAYVIEMNPRATPICHLPLGVGHNLPVALYTAMTGVSPPISSPSLNEKTIAMFPGEWHRDPGSPFLRSAYHDIPWNESALIQECIGQPWSERGLIARLWARSRSRKVAWNAGHYRQPIRHTEEPIDMAVISTQARLRDDHGTD